MKLNFEEIHTPADFRANHTRSGGRCLRRFMAPVPNGFLRVTLAEEPNALDPPRDFERHLSISASDREGDDSPPTRLVTEKEVHATLDFFFPPCTVTEGRGKGLDPHVRHFWVPLEMKVLV